MILHLHPTGNTAVRAALGAMLQAGRLGAYATTVGFAAPATWQGNLPKALATELARRNYDIPPNRLLTRPGQEVVRLLATRFGWRGPIRGDGGRFSIDRVAEDFAAHFGRRLPELRRRLRLKGVYAYDHAALEVFEAAKAEGLATIFELPIAYWSTGVRLMREEAERWPAWQPTLEGMLDAPHKEERKTRELELADVVVCPSQFVVDSLPGWAKGKRIVTAPFGSPPTPSDEVTAYSLGLKAAHAVSGRPLRVLFVGILSQRKGLADLFAAVRLLNRPDIELVVMGRPVAPMAFYRREFDGFTYEAPRPHGDMLTVMRGCDVFVFPSIVEGRALVMQEAMSQGLPIIITPNTGGEDLVEESKTGFLVPIRSPKAIAERLAWCADHRDDTYEMGREAHKKAARYTWQSYGEKIVAAVKEIVTVGQ